MSGREETLQMKQVTEKEDQFQLELI